MKAFLGPLVLMFVAATAQAGSFGGPPPFTNGSPLQSGVDGSYQANATGSNTTGVIRFAYSDNIQTAGEASNFYVFFSEGLTFRGSVQANLTLSSIYGVLERDTFRGFSNTALTGYFSASINPRSPSYAFKGKGFIQTFIQDATSGLFLNLFGKDLKVKGVRVSQSTGTSTTTTP